MPSAKSAEGKARQRARNQTFGADQPGSSGIIKQFMQQKKFMEWPDVVDEVEHVADLMGIVQQGNLGAATVSATMTMGLEYAHRLTDIHLATRGRVAFIRVYVAPMSIFDDETDDDDE